MFKKPLDTEEIMDYAFTFFKIATLVVVFYFSIAAMMLLFKADICHANESSKEVLYTFTYGLGDNLKVTVPATNPQDAFRAAGKICFQKLTKGKYPGEEAGLDIIDICANPSRGTRSE
jgi:hypothetical protein